MLNFRDIQCSDRSLLHPQLFAAEGHGSEYSFATLFFWGRQQVAFVGDTPVFFSRFGNWCSYQYPFHAPQLIDALRCDAHERGIPFRLFGMLPQEAEALQGRYPGRFSISSVRDSADYVYDIERLTQLPGKKLQAKRNHCNHFEAAFPDYRVLPLTPEFFPRCLAFTEAWYTAHGESGYDGERRAISRAFEHFEALHMEGIVLETSEGMVAYCMGNRIRTDTFDVNFEKALAEVNGAYPMINREFARYLHARYPELRFLNREDDMGIEGLRRAKESYFPDLLLEKLLAEEV